MKESPTMKTILATIVLAAALAASGQNASADSDDAIKVTVGRTYRTRATIRTRHSRSSMGRALTKVSRFNARCSTPTNGRLRSILPHWKMSALVPPSMAK
jgi:hypothetical protein